jgi:hypothetical protein
MIHGIRALCSEFGFEELLVALEAFDVAPPHPDISSIDNESRRCTQDIEDCNVQRERDVEENNPQIELDAEEISLQTMIFMARLGLAASLLAQSRRSEMGT